MTYFVAELSIYFDLSRGKFRYVYYSRLLKITKVILKKSVDLMIRMIISTINNVNNSQDVLSALPT